MYGLITQWAELYRNLLPMPCLLCGLPSKNTAICTDCSKGLPQLGDSCQYCAMPIMHSRVCGRCLNHPPLQSRTLSVYRYEAGIQKSVTAFKYHQKVHLAEFFSHAILTKLQHCDDLPEALIPIPLHPKRLRQRGFNQSALISRKLSKKLAIRHAPELLIRQRDTTTQSQLSFKERQQNLKNAFFCPTTSVPQHIAVIDDVITSGATTHEAIKALKKQGAQQIEIWTIARTIGHH